MAEPALSDHIFNEVSHILELTSDTDITFAGAAHDFQLTDADEVLWSNASAAFLTGSGGTNPTIQLSAYPAGTPGTASTLDIAAGAVTNGTVSDAVEDASFNIAIALASGQAVTKDQLDALYTAVHDNAVYTATLTANQAEDVDTLLEQLLKTTNGHLGRAPLALTQTQALLDAIDTFLKSSRDGFADKDLRQATEAVRIAMPARGTFAVSATGT